jgi:arabinofuranosyltransferase
MDSKSYSATRKVFPAFLVALALAARLIPGPRTIDDSYITFRYARNLLSGQGFTYNPGERVQGTTTPVYTLLMTGLGALSGGPQTPFPWLALGANALADATTCWLLWCLGRRLGSGLAGAAAGLLWAVAPYSVTFAIGGLETSLYVLLLTGMVVAYIEKRRALTAACAALALLTRPDALILVGPLLVDRLWRAWRKGEPLQAAELLVFILPCLAWGLFATLYFGSPIPHSVQAKLQTYRLNPNDSFIRLMQHYATPFLEQNILGTPVAIAMGLVLYPFLYLVGALRAWKAEHRILAYLFYPWLYLTAFAIPNPLIFRWYLTPPLPAYFLFILMGAERLLGELFKLRAAAPLTAWRQVVPALLVIALPLSSTLSEWRLHPDHGPDRPAPEMAWFKLELLYQQAAELIAPDLQPGKVLAAGDVGTLGYYTDARILDTVGLNSPQSLKYYPLDAKYYVTNYAIPADLILDQQPDFVVIMEVYGRLTLLASERFKQEYTLMRTLPTDVYGSRGMLIFKRAATQK